MTPRRIVVAALTAASLFAPATPAAATCWLGPVYLCDPKPTDPVVGEAVLLYNTVLVTVLCASGDTRYCF